MNALDDLAQQVRERGLILSYSRSGYAKLAFDYRNIPLPIRNGIRSRRRGLARLMQTGDVRVCPSPDQHRHAWFYAGRGRFACSLCQRLDAAQLGLWSATA